MKKSGIENTENSNPRKAAIYIRVSTSYQADKDSLPMQRKDLTAYAELVLGITDYVVFEDAGYSGKNTDRPGFQEMMKRIRKHEFSHVLVWKIDRVSRNLLDFAQMYQELRRLRVVFVSKNEQFDTSTAMGEAMLKIILVFAELERNMTAERVRATMISKANSGEWNGGRVPYGYTYDKDKAVFSINDDEAAICKEMKDDYIKNKSLLHTAKFLNSKGYHTRSGAEWSANAVWLILSSPFYCGTYRYNKYRGTEHRSINPEAEWVLVQDHHPAIFTQEEYSIMSSYRKTNSRYIHTTGQSHYGATHIFGGLVYCGKCGSRMDSSPGRTHQKDGYHPSLYTCPIKKKSKDCNNPSVNDTVIGEFVINYILNMLNAKKSFSTISTPDELQRRLLYGSTFKSVKRIDPDGLNEFFNLLARYRSDDSFSLFPGKARKKHAAVNPELQSLRKEKEKQERALQRLQDLFLYSDNSMSEKDFIIRKQSIISRIEEINSKLGMVSDSFGSSLSDEDFVKQASHLLISSYLKDKEYIYFRDLAVNTSDDVLRTYMTTILDSIIVDDSKIVSITFKNGLTHKFEYFQPI